MGHSRGTLILIGVLVFAMGLVVMLDALGVFPGSEARMNAPRWVVLVVASLFMMSGVYVLLIAAVGEAMARAFGSVLGIAIFAGLAATVHWIAFGAGDRSECSGGVSAIGIGFSGSVPDFECRAAFGYGALLMDFIFLRGTAWWFARRYPGSRSARAFEKVSEWGIGLMLLPLVLLVMALTRGKDAVTRLAGRLRSKGVGEKPPPTP